MMRISALSEIVDSYKGFLIDVWGVLHNGVTPYEDAVDCLAQLHGKQTLLLSNAPRRAEAAIGLLRKLGVDDSLHGGLLTSGEAVWTALSERRLPWFARLGTRLYHIGPKRDRSVYDGLPFSIAETPDAADFVLNTGPDDEATDPRSLDAFTAELDACVAAGLPMICANPDRVVIRGGVTILCAGALADYYRAQGGEVMSLGKPDPAIYQLALSKLNLAPRDVLAIGDSLHTDIAGANAAGIDSLWILGGIHAADAPRAEYLAQEAGAIPRYVADRLAW